MHTLLISNGLEQSKLNYKPVWESTPHGVRQEHRGYIDGSWHTSHWYLETLRIGMMFRDKGMMNGHSRHGCILQYSDGSETHFCQCLSIHLQSVPNLTKATHRMRRPCMSVTVIQAPCLVYLLLKSQSYFVCCQASFVI